MKKIFYLGIVGLIVFEILKVYFIMPMPGSQQMNSIDIAYFLNGYRWFFRTLFALMIILGSVAAVGSSAKWIPILALVVAIGVTVFFNFVMMADAMFRQPEKLVFRNRAENTLKSSSVILGVEHNGEAKAYPLQFIVYHHQVQDTVGGKPMIITYCSVCRTGRVFEPVVKGMHEKFRLVGMDHFNAMFEDETTKTWWRQVSGEAIAGPLKGESLPEVESVQMTLAKWFELYPHARVMQADEASIDHYDSLAKFEVGKSESDLTRTDSASWMDKSWVVGIEINHESKAYDWNRLKELKIINDAVGGKPIVLVLSADQQSFAAFERASDTLLFAVRGDTLLSAGNAYDFSGRSLTDKPENLKPVKAYQEFWHSWRTFHPATTRFESIE